MTRVALAGYGFAGRDIHAPLLAEAGCQVVAVSTRSPERAAAAREDIPGVQVVPGLDELLAVPGLDLVVLATPSGGHAAQVRAVVDAGLPCVVDKPLAVDAQSAADVVRYAAASGVPFTVFQNRRYDAEQATVAGVVADGLVGTPFRYEMRWERWRPVPKERWREQASAAEGGGLLLDLHSHLVDAAVQLFGPVARVHAELRNLTTPAEDDVFLALTHTPRPDGSAVISHLQAGALVGAPGPRTRVLGDRGAYLVTSFEGEATPFAALDEGDDAHEGWLVHGDERVPVRRAAGGHPDFYRAVEAWVRGSGPVPVDPADAVVTARVLDAARVSAREHRAVPLDA